MVIHKKYMHRCLLFREHIINITRVYSYVIHFIFLEIATVTRTDIMLTYRKGQYKTIRKYRRDTMPLTQGKHITKLDITMRLCTRMWSVVIHALVKIRNICAGDICFRGNIVNSTHVHSYDIHYPRATRCGGDIVTLLWFHACVRLSVRPSVRRPCEHDRDYTVACFFVKLGRHVNHNERMNPVDFRGQMSRSQWTYMEISF